MDTNIESLGLRLAAHGQEHVLRWWPELTDVERAALAEQIARVDFAQIARLYEDAVASSAEAGGQVDADRVRPASSVKPTEMPDHRRLLEKGERALRDGRVAVVLVAGGQGTRLGYDAPKGVFAIGPVTLRSLFQVHAEKIVALSRRYGVQIPLYVMTSAVNDAATRIHFKEHSYFGLNPEQVAFFQQGTMPAVDRDSGRLLMSAKHRLATSPNGHGGTLQALADQGHLAAMRERGIEQVFYYQVDNPLVHVADPLFVGLHLDNDAEQSLKVVPKLNAAERLGVIVELDERLQMIEYSDLPTELAERRNAEGRLAIDAGNIAVHVFDVSFLERLAKQGAMLPFHRAFKKVPYLDERGALTEPDEPNAIKFETFIFDTIPLAKNVLVVETSREEEFEPLKNAKGENSPATVRQALSNHYGNWLEAAGVAVPRAANGSVTCDVEISPLLARDAVELQTRLTPAMREAVERAIQKGERILLAATPHV